MSEYSWPDAGLQASERARAAWDRTIAALPVGTSVAGAVIGRQRFGVFIRLDGCPDAIGLAEITAMPRCMELPQIGDRVTGHVLWHADHNHQVKIKLTEWDDHTDLLLLFADRIGQVTKIAPIGAFVRIADCVEGLVRPDDLPSETLVEGQELPVSSIEDAEADVDRLPRGQELEQIRIVAQSHAYRSEEPPAVRLRWAKLSLAANKRFHGDDPRAQARMRCQEFMLRTWVIEHLGPDADPDWDPEALAEDTLAALTLQPGQAEATAANWRELPIEQIGVLRRHKNLTGHLDRLIPCLHPGPIKDQLVAWASVRAQLP